MEEKEILHVPQVLLLGNGLNRSYGGDDWEKVIEAVWENRKIAKEQTNDVPFPLRAVIGSNDMLDQKLKSRSEILHGVDNLNEIRKPLEKLLSAQFDHILTTNYSYEIERVLSPKVERNGEYCKNLMAHTDGSKRSEQKYLLHTYNQITGQDHVNKIWHIHGEARKPDSVVLGHYYYGQLLGRYIQELEERGNLQQKRQEKGEDPQIKSWLDAFIMGDVYVLGFGYDSSEMDMWWLLNRKKREKARHGKVIFYEPSYDKAAKLALLEIYGAEVRDLGYRSESPNYPAFYEEAIDDILRVTKEKRKEGE